MFDIMPLGEQLERWHGGIEDAAYEPLNDENQPWEDFGYNDSGIDDRPGDDRHGSSHDADDHERGDLPKEKDRKIDLEMQELSEYRGVIFEDAAYRWFLESLRRECRLAPATPDYMVEIRHGIVKHLPSSHIVSRHHPAERFKATFKVRWDPVAFLQEQGYEGVGGDLIETFVTLTGSSTDAQALTCIKYLVQTWPFSGADIMRLVKEVVSDHHSEEHACKSRVFFSSIFSRR
jgi:hypothetical protein